MNFYDFRQLPEDLQALILREQGTPIATRTEHEVSVILYQIQGFYAEVYFDKSNGSIQTIRSFLSTEHLDPYLDAIDIASVLQ